MIKLFSLGKKKEQKAESPAEDMLFSELQKIKEEIERGSTSGMSNLFGEQFSSQLPSSPQIAQQQSPQVQSPPAPTPNPMQLQPTIPSPTPQIPAPQPTEQQSTLSREEPRVSVESRAEHKEERAELYIKIDQYEKVLDILDRLKVKLKDLEHIINELKEIKEQENTKLEEMRDQLENTKENINDVLSLLKQ